MDRVPERIPECQRATGKYARILAECPRICERECQKVCHDERINMPENVRNIQNQRQTIWNSQRFTKTGYSLQFWLIQCTYSHTHPWFDSHQGMASECRSKRSSFWAPWSRQGMVEDFLENFQRKNVKKGRCRRYLKLYGQQMEVTACLALHKKFACGALTQQLGTKCWKWLFLLFNVLDVCSEKRVANMHGVGYLIFQDSKSNMSLNGQGFNIGSLSVRDYFDWELFVFSSKSISQKWQFALMILLKHSGCFFRTISICGCRADGRWSSVALIHLVLRKLQDTLRRTVPVNYRRLQRTCFLNPIEIQTCDNLSSINLLNSSHYIDQSMNRLGKPTHFKDHAGYKLMTRQVLSAAGVWRRLWRKPRAVTFRSDQTRGISSRDVMGRHVVIFSYKHWPKGEATFFVGNFRHEVRSHKMQCEILWSLFPLPVLCSAFCVPGGA